jgi:hypothetical protein
MFKTVLSMAALLAGASGALAQGTPTAPAAGPTTAPAAAAATYSDAEVQTYAAALVAVNKVQADTTLAAADKQPKMAAAVQQAGITPVKFNEISQAMQADKALQLRIQTAMAAIPH